MAMFLSDDFSSELKKEQFREFLKDNEIIEKLRAIMEDLLLAEVRPENPMDFIRERLGVKIIPKKELDDMEMELDDLNREIRKLRNKLRKLGVKEEQIEPNAGLFPPDDCLMGDNKNFVKHLSE